MLFAASIGYSDLILLSAGVLGSFWASWVCAQIVAFNFEKHAIIGSLLENLRIIRPDLLFQEKKSVIADTRVRLRSMTMPMALRGHIEAADMIRQIQEKYDPVLVAAIDTVVRAHDDPQIANDFGHWVSKTIRGYMKATAGARPNLSALLFGLKMRRGFSGTITAPQSFEDYCEARENWERERQIAGASEDEA